MTKLQEFDARSLLFIPADAERFIAKGAERRADVIMLDLEDGVAPASKPRARAALPSAVKQLHAGGGTDCPRLAAPGGDVPGRRGFRHRDGDRSAHRRHELAGAVDRHCRRRRRAAARPAGQRRRLQQSRGLSGAGGAREAHRHPRRRLNPSGAGVGAQRRVRRPDAEAAAAERLLAAFDAGIAQGKGAIALDGKMIDIPITNQARQFLQRRNARIAAKTVRRTS